MGEVIDSNGHEAEGEEGEESVESYYSDEGSSDNQSDNVGYVDQHFKRCCRAVGVYLLGIVDLGVFAVVSL